MASDSGYTQENTAGVKLEGHDAGATADYLRRILGDDAPAETPRRRATDAEAKPEETPRTARTRTMDDGTFAGFVSALKADPNKIHLEKLSELTRDKNPKRSDPKESGVFWKTPDGFVLDPYAVTSVAQATFLPDYFNSEGLKMLQEQRFRDAVKFYGNLAKRTPNRGDGWFGLGGAMLGFGNLQDAAACMAKGISHTNDFPVGALVANSKPGKPGVWLELARHCMTLNTAPSLLCAEEIIRETMRSPMAPDNLYMEADRERKKLKQLLKILKSGGDPARRSMVITERHERKMITVINATLVLVVLGGLAVVGVWLWKWQSSDKLFKQGMSIYFEADQMMRDRNSKPNEIVSRLETAFDILSRSARTQSNMLDSQFMVAITGHELLQRASKQYGKRPLPSHYKEMQVEVQHAIVEMKRLDPSGERTRRRQADLQYRPNIITLDQLFRELEMNTRRK